MLRRSFFVVLISLYNIVLADMETKVVDGESVEINTAPYSVFLDISCGRVFTSSWVCGASIINQQFSLTAAHCVSECTRDGHISVSVGHEHRERGYISSAYKFKVHRKYSSEQMVADLALVMFRTTLTFGPNIKRTVLVRSFPITREAYISGWGMIDEHREISTKWLNRAKQMIWEESECKKRLHSFPEGVICASSLKGFAAPGDSGSALVVDDYIQVGVVSYKEPAVSRSLIVYTNVSHYYSWIRRSTRKVFCG